MQDFERFGFGAGRTLSTKSKDEAGYWDVAVPWLTWPFVPVMMIKFFANVISSLHSCELDYVILGVALERCHPL